VAFSCLTGRSTRTRTGSAPHGVWTSLRRAAHCRPVPVNSDVRSHVKPAHYLVAGVVASLVGAAVVFWLAWLTSGAVGSSKPHPALFLLAPVIASVKLGFSRELGLLLSFFFYTGVSFVGLLLYIRRGGTV